jgi:hypothetical protein
MGVVDPPYPEKELDELNEKQRKILRRAVHKQLNTSPEIRRLLRLKTLSVYKRLTSKRKVRRKK